MEKKKTKIWLAIEPNCFPKREIERSCGIEYT